MGKKGGLVNKILMGKEKSEGYARASLPSNRWELFWDIFKGSFWKLVLVNLLMIIFFAPFFLLLFFKSAMISGYGMSVPYSQCFGVGYQSAVSLAGVPETLAANTTFIVNLFLPLAFVIAAIGLAGGAFVVRNMVWTEGIFVSNDFWRGIKQNFKQIALTALIYSVVFYFSFLALAVCDSLIASGTGIKWLFIVAKVLIYLCLVLVSIMVFHMVSLSVTYELKYRYLIKNGFLMTIGLLPQSLFFGVLALIPLWLIKIGGFFSIIGYIMMVLFGLSLALLVWTDFSQWAYDRFVNDRVTGAQKNRGIYEKFKDGDAKALQQYKEQLKMVKTTLNSKPIKPITDEELTLCELPTSFSRSDIEKLNESRKILYEDHERYVQEHMNDPEFATFNEKTEKEKANDKKLEKAKKALLKHNKIKK